MGTPLTSLRPTRPYEFVNKFPSKEYRTPISLCFFARITPISGFLHKLNVPPRALTEIVGLPRYRFDDKRVFTRRRKCHSK
jgi:hypothetical protein